MIRAAVVLAIAALLSAPAHASRSCLNKNEAARTWPGRVLAIDDDGCWTYFRRGLNPAPVDDSVSDRAANAQPTVPPPDLREWSNTMAAMADTNTAVQATPWIDRWPDMIVVPPKPMSVEPPQALIRTVLLAIAILALCVPLVAGPIRRHDRTAQAQNARRVPQMMFKGELPRALLNFVKRSLP
jgi:hypothetical protein